MSADRLFDNERVLVVAMRGWSDAGDSASDAVSELRKALELDRVVTTIDDERYYDFAATRPRLRLSGTQRIVEWPHTAVYGPQPANDYGIYVMLGDEPALNWRSFVERVLTVCEAEEISALVFVGSLLADAPHTREIQISSTSDDELLRSKYDFDTSKYEGPIGIMTAIGDAAAHDGARSVSLWASVPHYAQAPDMPAAKATLALTEELADLLLFDFDRQPLREAAEAWENRVTQAVKQDDELGQYVHFLEQTRDMVDSEAASGDAIAAEFEAFLSTDADDRNDDGVDAPEERD